MASEQLKQVQSNVWGSGPFEEIEALIAEMHDTLVEALGPQPGQSWLDVGCGTGGVTTRAARAGADVTGVDLAPALIETARSRAADDDLDITYEVGDAENLAVGDGSFEVVSSSVGVMFAPDHAAAAGELARVCAPGGRLGITAWRPDGGIGKFFRFHAAVPATASRGGGQPARVGYRGARDRAARRRLRARVRRARHRARDRVGGGRVRPLLASRRADANARRVDGPRAAREVPRGLHRWPRKIATATRSASRGHIC